MSAEIDPDIGRTIELVDYDPQWPALFDRERRRVIDVLGPIALAIEHVGSTSVPGLTAKPVIDMHLVVRDSADEAAYRPQLEMAGYKLAVCEPDWYEHRMFNTRELEVNLHVFSAGCPELDRCRMFRDWLRQNASDRELYASIKRQLALRAWRSMQDYADAKTEVITDIMARAMPGSSTVDGQGAASGGDKT
jgi:GrpB-like predicted nucleotidyltransferase (UPF0157 family)